MEEYSEARSASCPSTSTFSPFSFLAFAVIAINTVLNIINVVNVNRNNRNNNNNNNINDLESINMNTGMGRRRRKRFVSEHFQKDEIEAAIDFDRLENIIKELQNNDKNSIGCQFGQGSLGLQLYLNERFREKYVRV